MSDKFTFTIDHARGLVRIGMRGFYTLKDVTAFFDARRRAHAELGLPPNAHLTLNDLRVIEREIEQKHAADIGATEIEARANNANLVAQGQAATP